MPEGYGLLGHGLEHVLPGMPIFVTMEIELLSMPEEYKSPRAGLRTCLYEVGIYSRSYKACQ